MELKLLYSSSSNFDGLWHAELAVILPDDVTLQASNDFAFAFAIFRTFFDISKRRFVAAHPDDGDTVERSVGLSVSSSVETETVRFPT